MRRLVAVALALAAVSGIGPAQRAGAQAPEAASPPVITVIKQTWAPGEPMIVRGTGWPKGTVNVQICGNNGINGSPDCDMPSSRTIGVGTWGVFGVKLTVVGPPAPCPCVVLARTPLSDIAAVTPISIVGHPTLDTAPTRPDDTTTTAISVSLSVSNDRSWRDYLGFAPRRQVAVTVTNTGTKETGPGRVELTVGKDNPPDGYGDSLAFESLAPGRSTTVQSEVAIDSFAYGDYWVGADVRTLRAAASTTKATSSFPAGLLALVVLAILLIDLIIVVQVWRRRRRAAGGGAAPSDGASPAPVPPSPPGTPVDPEHAPVLALVGAPAVEDGAADERLASWAESRGVDPEVIEAIRRGEHRG